jgi:K+-sensing histidine kinase KdpD
MLAQKPPGIPETPPGSAASTPLRLAAAVHEIKTPISLIRGYAELLSDGAGRLADECPVTQINQLAGRIERLVADALDWVKLERGELAFWREPVDLGHLWRETLDRLKPEAPTGSWQEEDRDPTPILADGDRLSQALDRLARWILSVAPDSAAVAFSGRSVGGRAVLTIRMVPTGDSPDGAGESDDLGLALARRLIGSQGGEFAMRFLKSGEREVSVSFALSNA